MKTVANSDGTTVNALGRDSKKPNLATDEDTESQFFAQNTQRNPQKNVGIVTPNITTQRKNCAWSISKCVGNVESCQILWSIMLQQKRLMHANLSQLLTTQFQGTSHPRGH